jgi:hypothetical protein
LLTYPEEGAKADLQATGKFVAIGCRKFSPEFAPGIEMSQESRVAAWRTSG